MVQVVPIEPLAALIAGALIFLIPRLLNYIVAIYLIVIGLVGLFGNGGSAPLTPATSRGLTIPVPQIETGFDQAPLLRPAAADAGSV